MDNPELFKLNYAGSDVTAYMTAVRLGPAESRVYACNSVAGLLHKALAGTVVHLSGACGGHVYSDEQGALLHLLQEHPYI